MAAQGREIAEKERGVACREATHGNCGPRKKTHKDSPKTSFTCSRVRSGYERRPIGQGWGVPVCAAHWVLLIASEPFVECSLSEGAR